MTRRQLPSKELAGTMETVPTSPTSFNAVDTWVEYLYFANANAAARTITVLDRAASPKTVVPTISLAANTSVLIPFGDACLKCPGGITWSCSGADVTGTIFGYVAG